LTFGSIVSALTYASLMLLAAGPSEAAPVRRAIPWPQDDPFYKPPSGYQRSAPGAILRTRTVSGPLTTLESYSLNYTNAWQILYRTTDALGNAIATVTTLIEPKNPNPKKLLSYQVAEDSADEQCAPSYSLETNTNSSSPASPLDLILIDAALNSGWYVSIPDYEGPHSVFTCGLTSGRGVLDSIRAVLATTKVSKLKSTAGVVLWGYSGGALATGWAAEIQPTYASELKLLGAAMGGTPADLNATTNAVNKGPSAGLIPAGFLGLSQQYPDLNAYLQSQLLPATKATFNDAATQCLGADGTQFANQDIFSYFQPNFLNGAVAEKALKENMMGKYKPEIPLYMYHSINDEIVPFTPTQALVTKYCGEGSTIQFVEDSSTNHETLAVVGATDAFVWLTERLNRTAVSSGCSNSTTSLSAVPASAATVFGPLIYGGLQAVLGGA
jgi:pimeloyl-ACP methyl ester carboxylesterase